MTTYTHTDLAVEVAQLRAAYVDRFMAAWVNSREGDFTNEEYEEKEQGAYRRFRETYPAVNALLIPHRADDETAMTS